jgi:hypothetical protein
MRIAAFPVVATLALLACAGPQDLASQCDTLTDFCNARAKTECNTQVLAACQVTDQGACVTARAASCVKDMPQGTVYVPAAGPACLTAVTTAYATATLTAASLATVASTCEPIFSGPGPARSPCTVDYDCSLADGLRCLVPYGQTQGKCLQPNVVAPAAPCPGEADVCPDSYYCDPQSLVCVAQVPAGTTWQYVPRVALLHHLSAAESRWRRVHRGHRLRLGALRQGHRTVAGRLRRPSSAHGPRQHVRGLPMIE